MLFIYFLFHLCLCRPLLAKRPVTLTLLLRSLISSQIYLFTHVKQTMCKKKNLRITSQHSASILWKKNETCRIFNPLLTQTENDHT